MQVYSSVSTSAIRTCCFSIRKIFKQTFLMEDVMMTGFNSPSRGTLFNIVQTNCTWTQLSYHLILRHIDECRRDRLRIWPRVYGCRTKVFISPATLLLKCKTSNNPLVERMLFTKRRRLFPSRHVGHGKSIKWLVDGPSGAR